MFSGSPPTESSLEARKVSSSSPLMTLISFSLSCCRAISALAQRVLRRSLASWVYPENWGDLGGILDTVGHRGISKLLNVRRIMEKMMIQHW